MNNRVLAFVLAGALLAAGGNVAQAKEYFYDEALATSQKAQAQNCL